METKTQGRRLTLANKLAYGASTGGGSLFNQIASAFLLARIFDGITDLAMGAIVDKTHTKLGKARPWLLASAPLMTVGIFR